MNVSVPRANICTIIGTDQPFQGFYRVLRTFPGWSRRRVHPVVLIPSDVNSDSSTLLPFYSGIKGMLALMKAESDRGGRGRDVLTELPVTSADE